MKFGISNRVLKAVLGTSLAVASVLSAERARASAIREEEVVIQVKSVAEVDGKSPEIVLGDLIVARGVSRAALDTLKVIRLADTPNPGESRSFTAMGLEQIFRPHLRAIETQSGERISLRVPTRVTVVRKSFKLQIDDVGSHIKTQLKELCGDCEFEISGLQLPAVPASIPAGSTWSIKFRNELPKGSFSVPLEVSHEDGSKRTYWIAGVLAVHRKVPVASRSLQAGERVRPEDFNMKSKDITFANDIAANDAELAASVVARAIGAGQIIWRSGLRREVAVKTGDTVKVVAGSDGWQVMIDGIAQGSAYIGDFVKVKIQRTQKMISGLLTEKGVVEVR